MFLINGFQSSNEVYELVEKTTISYYLSGNTSFNVRAVDLYKINNDLYFSFLSRNHLQKIYIYEYQRQKPIDSIPVYLTGMRCQGYKIINNDSILVYQYAKHLLLLINKKGDVLKKYNLQNQYVDPKVWTPMPIIMIGNKVYLGGYLYNPETKYSATAPIVMEVNLKTGKISFLYHFPESYVKHNWGGQGVGYWLYYCYNPYTKRFLFSFPFDMHVYETDLQSINIQHPFSGIYLSESRPFYFNFLEPGMEKSCKLFVENPTFKNILYDPYRNVYYRIGEFPQKFTGLKWLKEITIIVYDESFHYLTEKRIKGYYPNAPYTMFIGPEGLHFQVKSSEDQMTFRTFVLKKNR